MTKFLVIIALTCCCCSAYSQVQSLKGKGTLKEPYLINTIAELKWMRNQINNSLTNVDFKDKYYKLMSALDFSSEGDSWTPIGTYTSSTSNAVFSGHFDGNGKIIRNMKIGSSATPQPASKGNYVGLFGYVENGEIINLGMVDAEFYTGGYSCGAIVGYLKSGNITSCYSSGKVSAIKCGGGIVGQVAGGSVANCYSTSSVSMGIDGTYAGGIVGNNSGNILNCYTKSFISVISSTSGNHYAGGIAGYNNRLIENCYSCSSVESGRTASLSTSGAIYYAGGIVGANNNKVINCYYLGGIIKCVSYYPETRHPNVIGYLDYAGVPTWSNYVTKELPEPQLYILYLGVDRNSSTPIRDIPSTMSNGNPLNEKPEDAMNKWVRTHPVTPTGQLVAKWKVSEGVNNGLPYFDNLSSTVPSVLEGSGTLEEPYQIENEKDLWTFSSSVLSDNATLGNKYYKLMNDIDYTSDLNWNPIGTASLPFKGHFDGNNKTVINLSMGDKSSPLEVQYAGLFGYIQEGSVKNLAVDWSHNGTYFSSAKVYSGGIAAYLVDSEVTNCHSSGALAVCYVVGGSTQAGYIGGIAGFATTSKIDDCYSASDIFMGHSEKNNTGGIVGACPSSAIVNCYSSGDVSAASVSGYAAGYVGGVVGDNFSGKIYNCYAIGNMSCNLKDAECGGIAGSNSFGEIHNCYSNGKVTASSTQSVTTYAGGIAGISTSGTIRNSLALNPEIVAVNSTSAAIAKARRIASELVDGTNNFVSASMILKSGTSIENLGTVTIVAGKENGDIISGQPVDLLNNWVNSHSTSEGIVNKTWMATASVNDGYPVFKDMPLSVNRVNAKNEYEIIANSEGIEIISSIDGIITVYSMNGFLIKQVMFRGGQALVNLPKGMYLVKTPDNMATKVVVQ